jgi:hypothetical protein
VLLVVTDASVEEIASEGRKFNWKRPCCPAGCPKVWGHGFVQRIFQGFAAALLLKRWRCPTCRKVITMMPPGFWPRYQTPVATIGAAIVGRFEHRGWLPDVSRQRGGHWLRSFLCLRHMDFPNEEPVPLVRRLINAGVRFIV